MSTAGFVSPLITPASKATPTRVSGSHSIRSWAVLKDADGKPLLPGANNVASDFDNIVSSLNALISTLKTANQSVNLQSVINTLVQTSSGTDSITIDPTTNKIVLTNSSSTMTLDPVGPSLTLAYGTVPNVLTLTIASGVLTISGTGTMATHGNITIDGTLTAAFATIAGALMAGSAVISGALSAGVASVASLAATGAVSGASVTATGNVSGTSLTMSGSPGISVVRTFRNAAGTGTSTDTFVDGILTSYTP